MGNGKTFFQAIDDKATRVEPAGGLWEPATFEQWLGHAKRRFNALMGEEKYAYEVLQAFYPPDGIDAIVSFWADGMLPEAYASQQFGLARPPKDTL